MRETTSDRTHGSFSMDLDAIRKRARSHVAGGAVTPGYMGDRQTILKLLGDALATELVCVLRYRRHHFMSAHLGGIAGLAVTGEFLEHAAQEQEHADRIPRHASSSSAGRPTSTPWASARAATRSTSRARTSRR